MGKKCAPIIIFTYNRLDHTERVIEALKNNELSRESDLFVYSDGARNADAITKVNHLREYLSSISGFNSVTIIKRDKNYGLRRNIIEGVTEVVDKYGKAIIVEDDILVTPFFLQYMNDSLNRYEDDDVVMEVSASHMYMDTTELPETFLIKKGFCHGWGTWKRAWDKYDKNESASDVMKRFDEKKRKKFNLNNATDEFGEVVDNYLGIINTWAVFWDVTIFENEGLVVVPRDNLVQNIGFDGSGEHCPDQNRKMNDLANRRITYFTNVIKENEVAMRKYREGCLLRRPDFVHRLYYRIERRIKVLGTRIRIKN